MPTRQPKRWFFFVLLAAIILSLGWDYIPLANSVDRLAQLRESGALIGAENLPLSAEDLAALKGAEAIKLCSHFEGRDWTLIAVDGTRNRKFIHDPQYCFQGTGWKCVEKKKLQLTKGKAEILKFTRDGETKLFAYWFDNGTRSFHSMPEFLFQATLRRITLGLSGHEPVFLTLYPSGNGPTLEEWKSVGQNLVPKIVK